MVLQQKGTAALWGWSDSASSISITTSWNGRKYSVKPDEKGAWKVDVSTPEGSFTEYTLTIESGKEKIVLSHVLIGEVWLGSGQSNMEMPLKGFDGCPVEGGMQEIIQSGRYRGKIRFSTLPKTEAYSPLEVNGGEWKESSPENAPMFGAAAWFFAKNIVDVLDVPVGIINNAWGGSRIEGWLPKEVVSEYPGVPSDSLGCSKIMLSMSRPTVMYYGQWCPVRNYTFKGVLWYQGESNWNNDPMEYADRMDRLISLWREETANPVLPVYLVELAPYAENNNPDGIESAIVREQQRLSASRTDECWIVSINDLVYPYEAFQIHPSKKKEVGERLSYMALNHTYGLGYFPGTAPTFSYMDVDGNTVTLNFNGVAEAGGFNRVSDIEGFEACGPDLVWHPSVVRVVPYVNSVILTTPGVDDPVAVRYSFRNFLPGNFSGANGLTVPPFRSDRLVEGETPVSQNNLPDGDFEGTWKGSSNVDGLGGRPMTFEVTLHKNGDGSWTFTIPGQDPKPAKVRGNKATVTAEFGNTSFPMDIRYHEDGSVWVEFMGNPTTELKRQ